jgi:hypothetical protein
MMVDNSPPRASRFYHFMAALLVVVTAWWLWRPLAVAVAILMTGKCRAFVVNNAAFWRTSAILMVGIAWGATMAIGISIASDAATRSVLVRILLQVEGFFAVGYVGYAPAPEDRLMYNKAGQDRPSWIGLLRSHLHRCSRSFTLDPLICVPALAEKTALEAIDKSEATQIVNLCPKWVASGRDRDHGSCGRTGAAVGRNHLVVAVRSSRRHHNVSDEDSERDAAGLVDDRSSTFKTRLSGHLELV